MEAQPLPENLPITAPALAARVAALLLALATLIAARLLRHPRYVAVIVPLWTRLTRAARRFDRAMSRLAAGTQARPARPGRAGGAPPARLPTRRAWLLDALRHEAALYTNRFERLLAEPGTAALLAASPQALRILRPICHMLGARHPLLARPRRPRARPAAPPPCPSPPAPADRRAGRLPVFLAAPRPAPAPPPRDPGEPLCHHLARWPFLRHAGPEPA